MRIAVFSDTHLSDPHVGIPLLEGILRRYLPEADMVLHAGDLVHPDLLLAFAPLPVYPVRGNLDPPCDGVPDKQVVMAAGFRIGLIHSWGRGREVEANAAASFAGVHLDALVYGHSHWPVCYRRDGVLFLNPGSCTDRRRAPRPTFGVLELAEDIRGRIINLDDQPD